MITTDQAQALLDEADTLVVSTRGNRIGDLEGIYLDEATGKPEWVSVRTDRSGGGLSLVPLAQADVVADKIHVPYDAEEVQDAPRVRQDGEHLTQQEEAELYAHYGLPYSEQASPTGLPTTPTTTGVAGASTPTTQREGAGQGRLRALVVDRTARGEVRDEEEIVIGEGEHRRIDTDPTA